MAEPTPEKQEQRAKRPADKRKPGIWSASGQDLSGKGGQLRSYLHHTAGPLTGFLMGFPLTLIYALGTAIRGPEAAGDVLTKLEFRVLGPTGLLLVQIGLVVSFLVAIFLMQRKQRFQWRYFGPLILESTLYAIIVVGLIYALEASLGIHPHHTIHPTRQAALLAAVGEAVNEETFLRWLMVPFVLWLWKKAGVKGDWTRGLIGLVTCSLIYALVGYFTGSGMGDTRTAAGFITFLAVGVIFTGLFLLRGYTVTVYTHLLYAIYWAFATELG